MQSKLFEEYLKELIEKSCSTCDIFWALNELDEKSKQTIIPNKEIPIAFTRIYCYQGNYFSSYEEITHALKDKRIKIQQLQIIDYIGDFAGEFDVLRLTTIAGIQMLKDENFHKHKRYNEHKSNFSNEPVWDIEEGSIYNFTAELRRKGQHFHQDDIDQENLRLLTLLRLGLRRK